MEIHGSAEPGILVLTKIYTTNKHVYVHWNMKSTKSSAHKNVVFQETTKFYVHEKKKKKEFLSIWIISYEKLPDYTYTDLNYT